MSDRLFELMTEQTERPLSPAEQQELDRLIAENPGWQNDDFELAATAIHLAFLGRPSAALPKDLAGDIVGQAQIDAAATREMPSFADPPPASNVVPLKPRPSRLVTWGGWLAAAAFLLAFLVFLQRPKPGIPPIEAQRLALTQKPGVVQIEWSTTEGPASTKIGDVVWDPETQTGFLRFEGLATNDPSREQYQLWIFDATRDQATPVDGGVFDARAGVTIVRIEAKLRVFEASMFAVTVERPGGVVVSKRERIVALAKVSG